MTSHHQKVIMNQPQLTTEELQNRVLELHQQNQQLQQQLQQVRPPTIATNPPQLPELLIPMFSGNSTGGTSNFTSFMRQIRLSIGRTDLTAIHPDEHLRGIRQIMSKLQGHASVWGNTIGLDELMDMSLPTFLTLLEDQFSRSDEINDLLENLTCPSEAKVPEFTSEFLLLAASSSFGEEALRRRYMRCLPTALQNCLRAAAPDAIATLQAVGNFAVKQVRHRQQLDSIFQPTGRPPRRPHNLSTPYSTGKEYQREPGRGIQYHAGTDQHRPPAGKPLSPPRTPMDIDVHTSYADYADHLDPTTGKLKPQVKDQRKAQGLCLYCGRHSITRECPSKPNKAVAGAGLPYLQVSFTIFLIDALLDSAASVNIMSLGLVEQLAIQFSALPIPIPVQVLNGKSSVFITHVTEPISLGPLNFQPQSFYVAPDSKFPCILGVPWQLAQSLVIDWKAFTVHYQSQSLSFRLLARGVVSTVSTSVQPFVQDSLDEDSSDPLLPGVDDDGPEKPAESFAHIPDTYSELLTVFSQSGASTLPPMRAINCTLPQIPDATPMPKAKVYMQSPKLRDEIGVYISDMLAKGFIVASTAPEASPLFMLVKSGKNSRPCVDYKARNERTVTDAGPIPIALDLVNQAQGYAYYTKLDLRSAYNLVRVDPKDQAKTAFKCHKGLFEYRVMPFGLKNAPAIFQRLINTIFADIIDHNMLAYIDDILIFHNDLDEHIAMVKLVLHRLQENQLYCKPGKCVFHAPAIQFLGYIISAEGKKPLPSNVAAVKDMPAPTNVRGVQKLLGCINFYRQFIPNYAKLTTPLTDLLKKGTTWSWGPAQQDSFDTALTLLTSAPLLMAPDRSKPFIVHTDASDVAIGCVLGQRSADGHPLPVEFYSRKLSPAERNYSTHDKELLAIVAAFSHFRPHLLGVEHTTAVYCDHANLQYFRGSEVWSARHARWLTQLSEYDFKIHFIPGVANTMADALSRRDDYGAADPTTPYPLLSNTMITTSPRPWALPISVPADPLESPVIPNSPVAAEEPVEANFDVWALPLLEDSDVDDPAADDEEAAVDDHQLELEEALAQPEDRQLPPIEVNSHFGKVSLQHDWPLIIAHYLIHNAWPTDLPQLVGTNLLPCLTDFKLFGTSSPDHQHKRLRYKDPESQNWLYYVTHKNRKSLVLQYHQVLGHLRHHNVLHVMKQRYWFPNLSKVVAEALVQCPNCLLLRNHGGPAPLKPILPTALPFREWHMDVLGPFPTSKSGNKVVLTAVDRATRLLVTTATPDSQGPTVVKFLYQLINRFGAPEQLITDRGQNFLHGALRQYEHHMCIGHTATTPYHAQANGMVERIHQPINHALRANAAEHQSRWDEFLPQVTFALNARKHKGTDYSPFYLAHGVEPRLPIDPAPPRALMTPLSEAEAVQDLALTLAAQLEDLGFARREAWQKATMLAEKQRGKIKAHRHSASALGDSTPPPRPWHFYRVGQLVVSRAQDPTKLANRWKGPFLIAKLGPPGTYWLQDINTGAITSSCIAETHLARWASGSACQLSQVEPFEGEGHDVVPPYVHSRGSQ